MIKRLVPIFLAVALAVSLATGPAALAQGNFNAWLATFKAEVRAKGISQATLDAAFAGVSPIESILALERKQPEGRVTFEQYRDGRLNDRRVNGGRKMIAEHAELLQTVGARFGVDPEIIVALWGMETSYGGYTGKTPVIGALTTLAFGGLRPDAFRRELYYALRIVEEGHITPDRMIGSWAGAMGQAQFMPTAFADFAIDFDGDGRKDIWHTHADVFASTANFLSQVGWRAGEPWGQPARIPDEFDDELAGVSVIKSLLQWRKYGVRLEDGGELPASEREASVVRLGRGGPVFLVFSNFRVIMRWNRSSYFAATVGQLADRIGR